VIWPCAACPRSIEASELLCLCSSTYQGVMKVARWLHLKLTVNKHDYTRILLTEVQILLFTRNMADLHPTVTQRVGAPASSYASSGQVTQNMSHDRDRKFETTNMTPSPEKGRRFKNTRGSRNTHTRDRNTNLHNLKLRGKDRDETV
jgi:hypothetical protein